MDNVDKRSQIRELFSNFKCKNFFEFGGHVSFSCDSKDKCGCKPKINPIWSPAFGDDKANVMLVAEAPSTLGGENVHLGGNFVIGS